MNGSILDWLLVGGVFAGVLGLTLVFGKLLVDFMRQNAFVQRAYEDAPATHGVKTGTPTMGGLLFLIPVVVMLGIDALVKSPTLWTVGVPLAVFIAGSALIGLVDDVLAIRRGQNRGLRGRTKFIATGLVGLGFLVLFASQNQALGVSNEVLVPSGEFQVPYWLWLVVSLLAIVATQHAVNLTDGLDGLAAGVAIPPLLIIGLFAGAAIVDAGFDMFSLDVGTIAALIGFLYYNRHPARLFMGDTGSLALGGIIAGSAILTGTQLLLIVIGAVFVAETLSVILQVASFKSIGKRIFRMSPLHHHFELLGWPETRVTYTFWGASALCSFAGAALYLGWPKP